MSLLEGHLGSGVPFRWLEKGSRVSVCDKCHRQVWPNAARLQVFDGRGPGRVKSRGSHASYWCQRCAINAGLGVPEFPEKEKEDVMDERTLF